MSGTAPRHSIQQLQVVMDPIFRWDDNYKLLDILTQKNRQAIECINRLPNNRQSLRPPPIMPCLDKQEKYNFKLSPRQAVQQKGKAPGDSNPFSLTCPSKAHILLCFGAVF